MKNIALLITGLAACVLWSARGADQQAVKNDMSLLQGTWSMVSGSADGYPIPAEMLPRSKRVCKRDEITATVSGQPVMRAKITIDPSTKPKSIDYQVLEGPTKGKKHLGIYEVDGDTFKSCFAAPGAERPADFLSKPGDKLTSSVWKRDHVPAQPPPK